ncbi:MAG: amino acid permease [Firmicutes bacterium]|nr:amino acid permease [Bacillota bacterium]
MDENKNLQMHEAELASEETEFRREIGLFGGASILAGIMIGGGIFYLGSYVMMRTGYSLGMCLLAWILGGVVSMLGGICYAELGAMMPKAGGKLIYLNEAFHPVVGFISSFSDWLIGSPGSISAGALALAAMFSIGGTTGKIFATAIAVAFTVFNLLGVKHGSILTNITVIGKVIPILIILFAALFKGDSGNTLSMQPMAGEGTGNFFGMVAFATVATLWAYEGWTNLNIVAEEIKNPKKNLPLSIIVAIGAITILYCLFNFAIWKVLPLQEMHDLVEGGTYFLGTEAAKRIFGAAGATLVSVGMAISQLGSINSMTLAFPRLGYAMGKEGHFFKGLGKLNKNAVPANAMWVQLVLILLLIWIRSLDQLTNLIVFTGQLTNVLIIASVLILRKKMPDLPRPYKVWGGAVTVIIAVLVNIALMYNTFMEDRTSAIMGLGVWVIGAIVYFIFDKKNKNEAK